MSHVTECEELINVEDVIMLVARNSAKSRLEEGELSSDLRCPVVNFLSDLLTSNKHLLACEIVFIVVLDCLLQRGLANVINWLIRELENTCLGE